MERIAHEEVEKHAGEVVARACDVLDEVMGSKWVGDVFSQRIDEEQASLAREFRTSLKSKVEYNSTEGKLFSK
jgi:hypothetical protein